MNNSLKTVLLLGLLSGILLAIGELLGGSQGLVTAFGFAVVMNFVSYWFSDKIVLKMYRAQEVGPEHRLSIMTRQLATRAGMPQFAAMFGGSSRDDRQGANPIAMIATIIFAPMAAMLVQAAISRSREFLADAGGAKIAGSPYGLVNALRKLEAGSKQIPLDANPATAHMFIIKPFSAGALLSMFSTHPPTEQRIQALMNFRQS